MRLQTALRANALFSLVSGIAAIAASGPISERFDIADGWVIAVGAGLIPFALGLFVLARAASIRRAMVVQVVLADLAWVVGAVALIAVPGVIATDGKFLLAGVTAVVALLAWLQWSAIGEAD